MRAARALLEIDQRDLAQRAGLSLPTIQRMESSEGVIRGNVDSLMKRSRQPRRGPWRAVETVRARRSRCGRPLACAVARKDIG
jgi:hypothetical protein